MNKIFMKSPSPGEQRRRQVDVLPHRKPPIIMPPRGVGRSYHGGPGL